MAKRIALLIIMLSAATFAQKVDVQRFQLFQGSYISTIYNVRQHTNGQLNCDETYTDTIPAVFKIDTQTGDVWFLASDTWSKNYLDSSSEVRIFVGWKPVTAISDTTVYINKTSKK